MRRREEFYCAKTGGGCESYFISYLRDNMHGNYTIECPNCGHHHYRIIKSGLITNDRHSKSLGQAEIIVGLKATVRKTPWHEDAAFRRAQLKAYNGGIPVP